MIAMLLASPLSPLENVMRHILNWLHTTIGLPWAWSIVVLTVLVRMVLVPLTVRQIHSMQNMQRFAPQMKEIWRERVERVPAGRDYVIVVRPGLPEAAEARGHDWLAERVDELLGKAAA